MWTLHMYTNISGKYEQSSQKPKLNYVHACKPIVITLPKSLIFSLANYIYAQNLIKTGENMGALSWTQA